MTKINMLSKTDEDFETQSNDEEVENDDDFTKDDDDNEEDEEDVYVEDKSYLFVSENKRKKVTDDTTDSVPTKKKKLEKDLYKQPTVEELSQLRETENLFHSNLFRLQIEEVLAEVKIKDKYKRLYETWFQKLKDTVESIEETEEFQLGDEELGKELDVHIPIPDVPIDEKGTFKFTKPSNVSTIGSYAFDATVGPTITVDVMIEMPSTMFQKHDYQNYRYLRKKAIYLAYVASNIQTDIAENKKFVGDIVRPKLKIIPNGKLGRKVTVLIHVSAAEDSFKLNRYLPEKNSVRPGWFFEETKIEGLPPTPHYNSTILHDLTMSRINSENIKIIKEYPNLRDGIILLKIWLAQRDLIRGHDGFTGHIITMYTLYLLSIKKLNTFMSSYQIVRNVWNNLVQTNWSENGITMHHGDDAKNRVLEYQRYYDCVFLDTTGYHNLAANITKATFSWIQREAELSIKQLDSSHADTFQLLFMRKVPFNRAFDHIIRFKDAEVLLELVQEKSSSIDKLNYGPDNRALAIKILGEMLNEGLKNRVHRICVLPHNPEEWECTEHCENTIGKIFIGLELDPEFCFSIVEKGPEANLEEAVAFRNFWGEQSELRRFQDGSIREAVVWSKSQTLADKRQICKRIVTFLLTKKLNMSKDDFTYISDGLEGLLKLRKVKITHFTYGTGEEATLQAIKVFDSLEKDLMFLTDIPLSIHGVQGSSPVFRYTEVFPPLATVYQYDKANTKEGKDYLMLRENMSIAPVYVHPLEVSLQLSTSGKWPDELEAIRKTKAAFHIQIANCLRKQHSLKAVGDFSHIDVLKDGFVFRLRVAHQKEIAFLKQQVNEDGVIKYRDNEESMKLEKTLFELPKLSGALHGLHSQQPSYGTTCCLIKRWLSSQLLDDSHIPDIVVDLLVASMFLMPAPYKPAQMPQVAFFRMLEIFARAPWHTDPVIVNFNSEMTREEIVAVETLFGSSRNTLPPLFIATPYDQQKSLWTKKAPTHLTLNRIASLAKETLKLFENQLHDQTVIEYKPLFRPPLSEYDCLIHLKKNMVPRILQAVDVPEGQPAIEVHSYKELAEQKLPVIDFDPVQCFLTDLRNGYDDLALFFYDTYGGLVIGVLLKPSALEVKDFKVSNINCRKCDSNGKLILNTSAMIQDFHILGKDLIESISIQSKKLSS